MKTLIKNLFLLPVLIAGLGLLLTGRATAQTFTTLHSFTNGSDGGLPYAGLILSGNTLYGTAQEGGTNGEGTVFAVNINGMGFTNLHSFAEESYDGAIGAYTNSDGADPKAGLILSGNTLYGTAYEGGTNGFGTVFTVNTNGSNFTNLHNFTYYSDGGYPTDSGGLVLSGNTLYGTAQEGSTNGNGTVFALNTDGMSFTNLHTFSSEGESGLNNDGAYPVGGLILSGNTLYGTASEGGTNGDGTVFALNTNGSNFMTLYDFTDGNYDASIGNTTNSDGALPYAGLILSGNTLYGTAYVGGTNGNGTVFALNTNGSNFMTLHSFTTLDVANEGTNSDGGQPYAGLILSGNTLYGTAYEGGSGTLGTVFAIDTNGMDFTTLHAFVGYPNDGGHPQGGLILSGNTLYGTTPEGGTNGYGTVFSLSLGAANASPPKLTIIGSGTNVILTWPTNATGFTLESATNLVSPVWNTNLPTPVVVNTNNAVTNGISGIQKFYRLSQ